MAHPAKDERRTIEKRLDRWYLGATGGRKERAMVDHMFWAGPEQDHRAITLQLRPAGSEGRPSAEYTRIDPSVITLPGVFYRARWGN